jgi:ADP-ribose pyrophosphatase YjhB (NUDIX family)
VIWSAGKLLLVRRPDDDESLPGLWGLPAATLSGGESEREAVRRAGRQKLGVEVEPLRPVGEASAERSGRRQTMRDWEARIVAGEPSVPQGGPATQYVDLRWGDAADLRLAAAVGSLCARVLLDALR